MQQRAIKNFFRSVNSRMEILGLITIRPGFVFEINEAGSAFIGLAGAVDIAINLRLIRKANKNFIILRRESENQLCNRIL